MQIGEEIVQLQLMSWGGLCELSHKHVTLESHMVMQLVLIAFSIAF